MKVTIGWSSEYARTKFAVVADETDLRRVLTHNGLDPDLASVITTGEAFKILDAEAEKFAMISAGSHEHLSAEEARAKIVAAKGRLDETLAALRQQYPPKSG